MDQVSSQLFNVHEIWAIAIASIYFLIGFPSNLLSIIVCCKSLFQNFFSSLSNKRRRQSDNKNVKAAVNNRLFYSTNCSPQEKLVNLCENSDPNQRGIYDEPPDNFFIHRENSNYKLKPNLQLKSIKRKNSMIVLNQSERQSIQLSTRLKVKVKNSNPHRKCFELYLVEISFCDLFILAYQFTECSLLALSKFGLIDPIYAEPVLISKFMCRFIIGLNRTVVLMHNWLVACMAITRCYSIYKPLNSNMNFGSKFYYRLNICVFLSLLIVFSILNIYGVLFLSFTKSMNSYTNSTSYSNLNRTSIHSECKISNENYDKYPYIEAYINITLGVIGYSLPCFITLIINLLLIYNIRNLHILKTSNNRNESGKYFKNIEDSYKSQRIHSAKSRNQFLKATSSLLTLSFSYLICYIPYSFLFLSFSLNLVQMNGDIVFAVSCLRYLNHTLNFYIYFATGKRFRNDVLKFLRIKK